MPIPMLNSGDDPQASKSNEKTMGQDWAGQDRTGQDRITLTAETDPS
jgi:hypothetical protein